MRCVGDHLRHLAQAIRDAVVQQQRQNNRKRKRRQQLIHTEDDGVAQHIHEHVGAEELFKVRHADPLAALDALGRHKALKCNLDTIQGPILEKQQIHQCWQQQHIEQPILPNAPCQLCPSAGAYHMDGLLHVQCLLNVVVVVVV